MLGWVATDESAWWARAGDLHAERLTILPTEKAIEILDRVASSLDD